MKKLKRFLLWMLILALLAVGGACIYFYPTWKAAEALREKIEFMRFSYEMEMELDKGRLSEGQVKMFGTLARLMGYEEDAVYRFTVRGSVWEERIYAVVYLGDEAEPLAEFYMDAETIVLNEAMVFNSIRAKLAEQYPVLGTLVPEQKGNVYISLEQVEQIFGIKIMDILDAAFAPLEAKVAGLTVKQCFVVLAAMPRKKLEGGNRFEISMEGTELRCDVLWAAQPSEVAMRLAMRDPAGTLSRGEWLLSRMGVRLPIERIRMVESFAIAVDAGEGVEIAMPTEYVDQNVVDLISQIRVLIEKLLGGEDGIL